MEKIPTLTDIRRAHERILPFIEKTPVLSSTFINGELDCRIHFKCENFQKVAAFKFRGAMNAVLQLSEDEIKRGVATHSSGNHAAALALAAQKRGGKAYIVMPKTAPKIKVNAVRGFGGEIIFCEPTLAARESTLDEVVAKTGAVFIHPYNNYRIITGQGTCALEFLSEVPDLDILMAPVGGGGLLSGSALCGKAVNSRLRIIAGEPAGADDAFRSLREGGIVPSVNPDTIADGLLTSLGSLTFPIIQKNVEEIITVSDDEIISAMRLIWEKVKIVIEPSSAVPLAAVMARPQTFRAKNVGIILSGGNVDLNRLPWQ